MEPQVNEELMMKASFLERYSQEIAEKLDYVSQQIVELDEFLKSLEFLSKSKEKEMFASVGRGIYTKSSLADNKLFVNVGAGVLVKKTPEETKEIIESQILQFHDAKTQLMAQMEVYNNLLSKTMSEIESKK